MYPFSARSPEYATASYDGDFRHHHTSQALGWPDQYASSVQLSHAAIPTGTHSSHQSAGVYINYQVGPLLGQSHFESPAMNTPQYTHHMHLPPPREMPKTAPPKNPHKPRKSYQQAIDIVKSHDPESLESIMATHINSTRPVILHLRNENVYLKQQILSIGNIVPGLVDPSLYQQLYAEQQEAFPLPTLRPLDVPYGVLRAPVLPPTSSASSPTALSPYETMRSGESILLGTNENQSEGSIPHAALVARNLGNTDVNASQATLQHMAVPQSPHQCTTPSIIEPPQPSSSGQMERSGVSPKSGEESRKTSNSYGVHTRKRRCQDLENENQVPVPDENSTMSSQGPRMPSQVPYTLLYNNLNPTKEWVSPAYEVESLISPYSGKAYAKTMEC